MWVRDSHPGLQRMRVRRTGVVVLLVLATLLWSVGIVAVWAQRQMLDTQNWVQTSDRLLENEEIRNALSTAILQRVYASAPVETRLRETLPPTSGRSRRRSPPRCARWPTATRRRCSAARRRSRRGRRPTAPRTETLVQDPQRRHRPRQVGDPGPPRPHRPGRRRHRAAAGRGGQACRARISSSSGPQDRQARGGAEGDPRRRRRSSSCSRPRRAALAGAIALVRDRRRTVVGVGGCIALRRRARARRAPDRR